MKPAPDLSTVVSPPSPVDWRATLLQHLHDQGWSITARCADQPHMIIRWEPEWPEPALTEDTHDATDD